ncbi:Omega-amidase [Abeliophyllum distichum]|uniref:Omega-amidase n=1 Tax=Abeliophyllum distichum TaxID=126358 RepID=A0ABD1QVY8_9LAMI
MFQFKIALCQLSVTSDKERNIAHAREAIEEAAGKGAQLILLPEIWNSPYSNDSFPVYAEEIDADKSPSTAMLSELSRSLKITIIGGSIPERSGDRLYNTCCVFGADGKLKAKHRKIHLFDIDIPGQMTFKESKTLTAGETPTIVDTDVGRIGIGICYDIRFQELAAIYAARGAHLLCYPGAFNMTTGPLHWELLQRARAADCQLYVATCSPARDSNSSYVAWGHSTLVGPFGEIIVTTDHDEAIVISEIDYSLIEQRRANLPFQKQRRGDLYQLVDVHRLNSTRTSIAGNSAANDSCKTCLSAIAAGSTFSVVAVAIGSKKSFRSSSSSRSSSERKLKPVETSNDLKKEDSDSADAVPVKREVNRCSGCRRKVGLTGFRVDVASSSAPIIIIPTGMIAARTTRPLDDRPLQGKIRWLR